MGLSGYLLDFAFKQYLTKKTQYIAFAYSVDW